MTHFQFMSKPRINDFNSRKVIETSEIHFSFSFSLSLMSDATECCDQIDGISDWFIKKNYSEEKEENLKQHSFLYPRVRWCVYYYRNITEEQIQRCGKIFTWIKCAMTVHLTPHQALWKSVMRKNQCFSYI